MKALAVLFLCFASTAVAAPQDSAEKALRDYPAGATDLVPDQTSPVKRTVGIDAIASSQVEVVSPDVGQVLRLQLEIAVLKTELEALRNENEKLKAEIKELQSRTESLPNHAPEATPAQRPPAATSPPSGAPHL